MATHTITHKSLRSRPCPRGGRCRWRSRKPWRRWHRCALTVVLMAMAIFIVLVATLDQVEKDFLQVKHEYFLSLFSWIRFQVFFPPAFFPSQPQVPGGFWFPGGKLIGAAMAINLLAAHGIRFKLQARGLRLLAGLCTVALGCVITWLVVQSGSNKEGILESPWIDYTTIWRLFVAGLVGTWLASVARRSCCARARAEFGSGHGQPGTGLSEPASISPIGARRRSSTIRHAHLVAIDQRRSRRLVSCWPAAC